MDMTKQQAQWEHHLRYESLCCQCANKVRIGKMYRAGEVKMSVDCLHGGVRPIASGLSCKEFKLAGTRKTEVVTTSARIDMLAWCDPIGV